MIDAKTARSQSESLDNDLIKKQLLSIEQKINDAIKQSKFEIVEYSKLNHSVTNHLKSLGYSVKEEYSSDPREGGYFTTISW